MRINMNSLGCDSNPEKRKIHKIENTEFFSIELIRLEEGQEVPGKCEGNQEFILMFYAGKGEIITKTETQLALCGDMFVIDSEDNFRVINSGYGRLVFTAISNRNRGHKNGQA